LFAVGSIAIRSGSFRIVPTQMLTSKPEVAFALPAVSAEPVVRRIPLLMPRFVVAPLLNVPYAPAAQFMVIFETAIPCPMREETIWFAVTVLLMFNCAFERNETNETTRIKKKRKPVCLGMRQS
jgi:hypothetical protein